MTKGVVIKSTGSWYDVKAETGDVIKCRLKGIFRLDETKDTNPISVGDRVDIERSEAEESWVISSIDARTNYIVRSSPKYRTARQIIAANMDQCLLIATMANPRTSTGFIDRFLLTAEAYHIRPIIVFNKQDLLDPKTKRIEELKAMLKNKTTLVSGHSGVGKSSLMNAIDPALNLRTLAVSKFSGKGMHTTTFAEMHFAKDNARIIDTPGLREFGIMDFKPEEISHYFVEMRAVLNDCKFNNCLHENEPGCAVKKAYQEGKITEERYANYLNIMLDYKANYKHWE